MKKIIISLCLTVFGLFTVLGAGAYQIKADAMTKRVPAGVILQLEAANTITTETLSKGDMFSAYILKDVVEDGTVVIPKGTIIRGSASDIVHSRMLSKSAILYLNFDHLVAPNGKQIPLRAGIASALKLTEDGGIDGGGNYGTAVGENLDKSGEIIKRTTKWGVKSGEELFTGGKYLVTPFAAVGGTIAGAGYFVGDSIADLFRKGKDVVILKGQEFSILLLEPVDVPVF